MNTKTCDVFFMRRRSGNSESTVAKQVFEVEDGANTETGSTMTTIADSVRPLLISMKLFGMYFRCGTEAGYKVASEKSRRRLNGYMIYGLVVAILLWINVARLFSVFKNTVFMTLCLNTSCVYLSS